MASIYYIRRLFGLQCLFYHGMLGKWFLSVFYLLERSLFLITDKVTGYCIPIVCERSCASESVIVYISYTTHFSSELHILLVLHPDYAPSSSVVSSRERGRKRKRVKPSMKTDDLKLPTQNKSGSEWYTTTAVLFENHRFWARHLLLHLKRLSAGCMSPSSPFPSQLCLQFCYMWDTGCMFPVH